MSAAISSQPFRIPEWPALRADLAKTNLHRMWWLLIASTSLTICFTIYSASRNDLNSFTFWQWFDLGGSALFLILIGLARAGRLPFPISWSLSPAYFAFWLLLMDGYYFTGLSLIGEIPTYAIGIVTPAVIIVLPPRIFLSLLVPNHILYVGILLGSSSINPDYSLDAVIGPMINGTLAVLLAVLAAWFLFDTRQKSFRYERKILATNQEAQAIATRLQASDRAKSEFLAMMSHEIRTPINIILGFAGLLREKPLPATEKEHVETIFHSGQLLLSIITDILDFSKIEADKLTLHIEPIALRDLISQLTRMFNVQAGEKGLTLEISIGREVPSEVEVDIHRLTQILLNLLSNAIKFTDTGTITIRVSAESSGPGLWQLFFHVSDTGIGIPPEQLGKLFQPFSQADTTVARRYSGTGLGLVIVKRLCQMMDGDITVQSTVGEGSTFTASLSAREGDPEKSSPHPAEPARDFSDLRVLVVEDNPSNRKFMKILLKRLHILPSLAASGEEALQISAKSNFDLILMDVQMPGMDGFEATQKIRADEAARSKSHSSRIVALTAMAMAGDEARCLEAGMNGYLAKPLRPDTLQKTLEETPRLPS